jgi:hypothetical protein
MMLFLTLVGIGLALVLFLNVLQVTDKPRRPSQEQSRARVDAKKVLQMPPDEPRPRICPVCGTLLGPEDYLIAALEPQPKTERKRQAHIYGCPYCFETDGVNTKQRQFTHIQP